MRLNVLVRLATAFAVLPALAAAADPSPVSAPISNPETIFEHARRAWASGAYPHYATYVEVVRFSHGNEHVTRTWETTEDLRGGLVHTTAFSREERARAYQPSGINIAVPFLGNLNRVKPKDPIGPVAFGVDQDFGLSGSGRHLHSVRNAGTLQAAASNLPVIGRTGIVARDYDVSLIDTKTDTTGTQYHLGLRPLRDRSENRLRELWVDGTTWRTEAAVVEGIGARPPLNAIRWHIDYRDVDGASYIASEAALAPVDYGADGTLTDVTITFDELSFSSRMNYLDFGFSDTPVLGEP